MRIEDLLSAFCFLLDSVRRNMFVPGKVENWLIIIDINFMSLFNVPLKVTL